MASATDNALKSAGSVLSGNEFIERTEPCHSFHILFHTLSLLLIFTLLPVFMLIALSEKLYIIKGGCGAARYFTISVAL